MKSDTIVYISLIIGTGALFFALMNAYVMRKYIEHVSEILGKISYKINLIEITLAYHDMIDIPYEIEDYEELFKEVENHIEHVEREGNVIYLNNKDREE